MIETEMIFVMKLREIEKKIIKQKSRLWKIQ